MLEQQSSTVDRIMVLTPSPVGIDFLVLPATAALLNMKVIGFVTQVDNSTTTIAPDDREMASIDL